LAKPPHGFETFPGTPAGMTLSQGVKLFDDDLIGN
jgi:hypothetical protein